MSAINQEKIYEELRNYHTNQFPDTKNSEVENLRTEFGVIEDKIIGMLLSLMSGKTEFVDITKELNIFKEKIANHLPDVDNSKQIFISKISKLFEIMAQAKESNFQMKKTRIVRS
jgi:hypothetical protein